MTGPTVNSSDPPHVRIILFTIYIWEYIRLVYFLLGRSGTVGHNRVSHGARVPPTTRTHLYSKQFPAVWRRVRVSNTESTSVGKPPFLDGIFFINTAFLLEMSNTFDAYTLRVGGTTYVIQQTKHIQREEARGGNMGERSRIRRRRYGCGGRVRQKRLRWISSGREQRIMPRARGTNRYRKSFLPNVTHIKYVEGNVLYYFNSFPLGSLVEKSFRRRKETRFRRHVRPGMTDTSDILDTFIEISSIVFIYLWSVCRGFTDADRCSLIF